MEYRLFDLFLCALILSASIYGWGRFKRFVASGKLNEARRALIGADYREAVRICQGIAEDMRGDPEFWYVLAVALAGAGSSEDAAHALEKTLALKPDHRKGMELMEVIRAGREE
jgi:predicted Zn-dependent protease